MLGKLVWIGWDGSPKRQPRRPEMPVLLLSLEEKFRSKMEIWEPGDLDVPEENKMQEYFFI